MKDFDIACAARTAIVRQRASVPARWLIHKSGYEPQSIFDWGCGHGTDSIFYHVSSAQVGSWDPVHRAAPTPEEEKVARRIEFEWVTLTYVLNVLPRLDRLEVLPRVFEFLPSWGKVMIAVRDKKDVMSAWRPKWDRYGDGFITSTGSFQRGFSGSEIAQLAYEAGFKRIDVVRTGPLIVVAHK